VRRGQTNGRTRLKQYSPPFCHGGIKKSYYRKTRTFELNMKTQEKLMRKKYLYKRGSVYCLSCIQQNEMVEELIISVRSIQTILTVELGGVTGVSAESAPSNCSVTQASVSILINPIFTQVHQYIVSALFVRHKHHTLIRIKNK
jgi:hypothetical protein